LGKIEKLYAFSYQPQQPEKDVNGWTIYDARTEWKRLGISEKGTDKRWRISRVNTDYGVGRKGLRLLEHLLTRSTVFTHVPCPSACTDSDIRQYS